MLAQALTVLESDEHRCGHRLSRSTNPAMDGSYEADADIVCFACAADEEFRKAHKGLPPGAIVRVHDTWPADEPLPEWQAPDADEDEDPLLDVPDGQDAPVSR